MVVGTFWSTEINFWLIPTHESLIPVSDTVLAHFQGLQATSDVKKSVWDKSLVTRDRAWTQMSELSQGSLGAKIALKTTLEGVISTRNGHFASGVFRRHTYTVFRIGSPYDPRSKTLTEKSINVGSGLFSEIRDSYWDFRCHRLSTWWTDSSRMY